MMLSRNEGGVVVYSTILFDIDGVMLSEERYFDASALTVYEMLCSDDWLGLRVDGLPDFTVQPDDEHIQHIRSTVFANDAVLDTMKSAGVNANWDMVYLQFMYQWYGLLREVSISKPHWRQVRDALDESWGHESIRAVGSILREHGCSIQPESFAAFSQRFGDCADRAAMFTKIEQWFAELFESEGQLADDLQTVYDLGVDVFQAWYLGDEYSAGPAVGKHGFVQQEIPLAAPESLAALFELCTKTGATLGVATGRPQIETEVPFHVYGWERHFPKNRITTASDVRQTEQRYPHLRPLSKPHPFSYVRSWLGTNAESALAQTLPLPTEVGQSILIVGDSVADWKAARSMGCHFAAVLTGLTGAQARQTFEQLGCEYILNNVLDLAQALHL
jgi:phosphoglycolate phosphatase-like HAD superfamily hydrolase